MCTYVSRPLVRCVTTRRALSASTRCGNGRWNWDGGESAIRVLDRDLGHSAKTAGREDFKTLVADVSYLGPHRIQGARRPFVDLQSFSMPVLIEEICEINRELLRRREAL